jgi:hypothetical protein
MVLSGPMLPGSGLPFDLSIHLWLSSPPLGRRTAETRRWTLPAYQRYEDAVSPASFADVVIRADRVPSAEPEAAVEAEGGAATGRSRSACPHGARATVPSVPNPRTDRRDSV